MARIQQHMKVVGVHKQGRWVDHPTTDGLNSRSEWVEDRAKVDLLGPDDTEVEAIFALEDVKRFHIDADVIVTIELG